MLRLALLVIWISNDTRCLLFSQFRFLLQSLIFLLLNLRIDDIQHTISLLPLCHFDPFCIQSLHSVLSPISLKFLVKPSLGFFLSFLSLSQVDDVEGLSLLSPNALVDLDLKMPRSRSAFDSRSCSGVSVSPTDRLFPKKNWLSFLKPC